MMTTHRQTGIVALIGAMVCHVVAAVPISDIPWEAVSSESGRVVDDYGAWVGCFRLLL